VRLIILIYVITIAEEKKNMKHDDFKTVFIGKKYFLGGIVRIHVSAQRCVLSVSFPVDLL
jgi:hypothetical protein